MIYLAAGLNLLNVNPGLLIWTLVTFTIVVLILWKFAWNPIIHALDARAEKIHGDIEKAEKLKKDAEGILASYNTQLQNARKEASEIVGEAGKDAKVLKDKTISDTQQEIKHLKEQATKEIELAKAKALQEIQEQVVELSVAIAGQILEKKLKSDEHSTFVKSEIARIKNLKV